MNKSTYFFGQSVFGQLISMIDTGIIARNSKRYKADHYVKRFMAKDHLVSMLFCVFANKRRSVDFFSGVYHDLLREYQHVISDTRFKAVLNKQVEIFDS